MVRFAHIGDTHLCRTWPVGIEAERVEAFNFAFQQVIDKILEADVDFVIQTGDLFDKVHPWPNVVKFAKQQLDRLTEENIPIYLIRGNHDGTYDYEGLKRGCSIDLTWYPRIKNVNFIDPLLGPREEKLTSFNDFSDEVRIIGLGYYGYEVRKYYEQYAKPAVDESKINILILHSFVEGYTGVPPGQPFISLKSLEHAGLNYVAVGHTHDHIESKTLKDGTTVVCAGSIDKWVFDESDKKGFYLVDLNDRKIKTTWIPIENQYFMTVIPIETTTPKAPHWFVNEAITQMKQLAESSTKKLIVNIRLRGELSGGTPADIPFDELDKEAEELKKIGKLLYHTISPPDINIQLRGFHITTMGFDLQSYLSKILRNVKLANDIYGIHQFVREKFEEEDNLTAEGNLKEEVQKEIIAEIRKKWGV